MVIDTSALLAILFSESTAPRLLAAIHKSSDRFVSAATVVEAALVATARIGEGGDAALDRLLRELDCTIVPVTPAQSRLARDAAIRFGRGRHQASLNFGDLFPYALAADLREPLLFVGDDFARTDVEAVV